jgi:hypothetical protein
MYNPNQILFTLIAIAMFVVIAIALTALLRAYLWWLLGIQKRIDQNDEIILLLKYIAAGKQLPPSTKE